MVPLRIGLRLLLGLALVAYLPFAEQEIVIASGAWSERHEKRLKKPHVLMLLLLSSHFLRDDKPAKICTFVSFHKHDQGFCVFHPDGGTKQQGSSTAADAVP